MKPYETQTHSQPSPFEDSLLGWNEVHEVTGISRTGIWRLVKKGQFPPARQLSINRVGWLRSEVLAWIRSRPVVGISNSKEGTDNE